MSNRWVDNCYTAAEGLPGRLNTAGYQTWLVGKNHYAPSTHTWASKPWLRPSTTFATACIIPSKGGHAVLATGKRARTASTPFPMTKLSLAGPWTCRRSHKTQDPSRPFFGWIPSTTRIHHLCQRETGGTSQGQDVPDAVFGDWSASIDDIPPAFLGVTKELADNGSRQRKLHRQSVRTMRSPRKLTAILVFIWSPS